MGQVLFPSTSPGGKPGTTARTLPFPEPIAPVRPSASSPQGPCQLQGDRQPDSTITQPPNHSHPVKLVTPDCGAVTSSSQAPRTTHETPGPETRSSPRGLPPSQTHSHRRPLVTTRAASVTDTQPPTPPRHQERCLCHRHTATDAPSSPSTPNVITRFEYPVPVLHLPLGPPHNQTRTAHAAAGAEPLRILGNSPTGGHRPQPRVVSPRYAVSGPRPHKLSHAGKPTQPRAQTHSHRHTPTPTLTSLLPGSVPAATTRTSAQAPLPASAPRACALPSGTPEHRWPRPLTRATRRRDAAPPPGLPPERKDPPRCPPASAGLRAGLTRACALGAQAATPRSLWGAARLWSARPRREVEESRPAVAPICPVRDEVTRERGGGMFVQAGVEISLTPSLNEEPQNPLRAAVPSVRLHFPGDPACGDGEVRQPGWLVGGGGLELRWR
nr:PREDICTED: uncharacterized protein-like [Equus przewalskii]